MDVKKRDFFREATFRICSSLEIEEALHRTLLFIKDYIPAKSLILGVNDHNANIAEIVAYATMEDSGLLSLQIPYSAQVKKDMEKRQKRSIKVWQIDRFGDYEGTTDIAKKTNVTEQSGVLVDLVIDNTYIGILTIAHEKDTKFNKKQLQLLNLLHEPFAIALSNYLRYREIQTLRDLLADDNRYLQDELKRLSGSEVVGADFGLKGVMEMVHRVAHLDSPVLLLGETGVGKEVIANTIHQMSPRRDKPFVSVNCGAIPETLMDSELFGYEKGAFTGANFRKRGRFERANGGTIFLDEIGELQPNAQIRLLRVLQEKEIERVGGSKTVDVDIRVIAATHRNLETMIQDEQFRKDLYFRLKVFPIVIPPLRERTIDIPTLISYFIQKKSRELNLGSFPVLAPGVIDRLMTYHWPGNVRELQNAVERALILYKGEPLTFEDIDFYNHRESKAGIKAFGGGTFNLDKATADHIRKVLEVTRGKIHGPGGAAELLGINSMTLRSRMKKLGIVFGRAAKKSEP